jgi:hypothetical protein
MPTDIPTSIAPFLARIKSRFDRYNLFRLNQNFAP